MGRNARQSVAVARGMRPLPPLNRSPRNFLEENRNLAETETIVAHSVSGHCTSRWETLEEHSRNVAAAAEKKAMPFGAENAAQILGLLHDLGEIKPAFPAKLAGKKNDAPHSGEGALILHQTGGFARCLAGAIAGHHGRLPNPGRLKVRLGATTAVNLPKWRTFPQPLTRMQPPSRILRDPNWSAYRLQFLVRMLYGCLTDADDRETAAFYERADGKPASVRLVLSRFRSGLLRAMLSSKEIGYGSDIQQRIQAGCGILDHRGERLLGEAVKKPRLHCMRSLASTLKTDRRCTLRLLQKLGLVAEGATGAESGRLVFRPHEIEQLISDY